MVPLYISLLFKDMKERGLHEDTTEQIHRLFADHFCSAVEGPTLDEGGRIRIDDWEMRDEVQSAVAEAWQQVNTENLDELGDFEGYQTDFLKLFGFGLDGVDYGAEADPMRELAEV